MGTWMKETDRAIYLMDGNGYIDLVAKRPSQTNPQEQVANIAPLKSWFARSDKPRRMTVSIGTGAPEPEPIRPDIPGVIEHNGRLKVVNDTYFKLSPKNSSELPNQDKVFVREGTVFDFASYQDVGGFHWLITFAEPIPGGGTARDWYIFMPHIRLMADAVLTITHDTYFKLEPKLSSTLPLNAKVFVKENTRFNVESFLPAPGDHTQIELADTTLGANNSTLWYVYNLHFASRTDAADPGSGHRGMQIQTVYDTYFTQSPNPPGELPDAQKVQVRKDTVFDIQFYRDASNPYWQIELVNPVLGNDQQTSWFIDTRDTKLISDITLTVTQDTSLKLEPKQSSQLPDSSKVFLRQDSQLPLVSHLPAPGNHAHVELANTALVPNGETRWYAYNPHIIIDGQRQFLQVVRDTVFKTSTASSTELPDDEKVWVKRNTVFELSSYHQPKQNHIKVFLKGALLGTPRRNVWYCYVPDIYVVGTEIGNRPEDSNSGSQPTNPGDRGIPLQFPGFSGTYYANDPIFWETQHGERGHFTWGEALHVDPKTGNYRRPASAEVITNIQRMARVLEDIRKRYGDRPIQINSWYRDPATNASVGGASQSRHTQGDAVDFVVPGVDPYTVYADLDAWWGDRGGLASSRTFTHIDARGYKARWDYDSRLSERDQSTWGTWVKETDLAIYLMRGNAWISRLMKSPSPTNPQEQVLDVAAMDDWFTLANRPTGMTFSMGTGAPEPEQWVEPPSPGHTGETNASGIAVIKHFEGLRTTAYQDPVGIWTIGYGHTSMAGPPPVTEGMVITEAEAETILRQDLDIFERGVADALTVTTNADQFSAMVSFAFNVGLEAFRNSTLRRKHNAGDFAGAADEFLRWVYAGGEVLPGLERRRKAERALYRSEDYQAFMRGSRANSRGSYSRAAAITAGVGAIAGFAYGLYTQFIQPPNPDQLPPAIPESVSPPPEPQTSPVTDDQPGEAPAAPEDINQPVG